MKLAVNEIFGPTIQGEGRNIGKPCIFVRLFWCNLQCEWCDSKHSWDSKNIDLKKELIQMKAEEVFRKVFNIDTYLKVRHVVITGWEPLLQMKGLESLVSYLVNRWFTCEIESNWTIEPSEYLVERVSSWNFSPKLKHSCNSKAIDIDILRKLNNIPNSYFKFVIASDNDYYEEVSPLIEKIWINRDSVYLMALWKTKDELKRTVKTVIELCIDEGLRYSPRLHIDLWGDVRKV